MASDSTVPQDSKTASQSPHRGIPSGYIESQLEKTSGEVRVVEINRVGKLRVAVQGVHVVLPDDAYYGFRVAAREVFPAWGIASSLCPMPDPSAVRAA